MPRYIYKDIATEADGNRWIAQEAAKETTEAKIKSRIADAKMMLDFCGQSEEADDAERYRKFIKVLEDKLASLVTT